MSKVLSVDINSFGLNAAIGSLCNNPAKPVVISRIVSEPYDDGEDIEQLLHSPVIFQNVMKRLIQKNKLKVRKIILTVSTSFFVRELELPVVRENELAEMVRNEMNQYISPGRDDVIGFTVINEIIKDSTKYYRIRAAVMDGDVAKSLYKGLKDMKLSPLYLDVGINTLSKLINVRTKINGQEISKELCLLADIGYNSTTISLFRMGKLEIQRTLNSGIKAIDSAISDDYRISVKDASALRIKQDLFHSAGISQEEYSALRSVAYGICEDINKLIQFTGNRMILNENVSIYLYGLGASTLGLSEFINQVLNISTHRVMNLSGVEITDKKNSSDITEIFNAVGAMLRFD
ncbi:MAG: pilus assembly protein PilM [Eubacteriales bacterium]